MNDWPTVNSLSGGKTSSYMAVHYPADYEVFALCCIDNHNLRGTIDPKIRQMVNDRLQIHCPHQNEFYATSEDPKVLRVILELEQKIGREIIWLRGMGWEQMLEAKQYIPNVSARFCTSILKMQPIFDFLFRYDLLPCRMRLGFRKDEMERMHKATDTFKYAYRCDYHNSGGKVHRWDTVKWRENEFPLIEHGVFHYDVQKYWERQSIEFPKDSNCQNCFWKDSQQIRKNFDEKPKMMMWAAIMEEIYGARFKKEYSFLQMKNIGIQKSFMFGTGSGCQAGFCTD